MIKKWPTGYSPVEKSIDLQISGLRFELSLHIDSVCEKPPSQARHTNCACWAKAQGPQKVGPPITPFNVRDIVAKIAFYVCN